MPDNLTSLLADTEVFGSLEADSLKVVSRQFRAVKFRRGQTIYSRGDPGSSLYLVGEGQIRFSIVTGEGRELSVRVAKEGDLVGEIALFDRGPRTANAVALTAVLAWSLSQTDFDHLLLQFPHLARGVIDFVCRRLRETTDQMESIALYSIEARLARFLLVAINGQKAKTGKRIPLELGFSQSELAQLLGASRPKVNTALGVLEEAGAIGRTSDRLFCDPLILARMAGRDDD